MRRYPAHIRNFYDSDGDDGGDPVPLPTSTIAPTARRTSLKTSTGPSSASPQHTVETQRSASDSSASIEDVIACGTFSPPPAATAHEYVSLSELRASVAAAERDVRRLRALMVKAVWHAITQAPGGGQSTLKPARGNGGATRDDRTHAVTSTSLSLTGFISERPFLPPDRYPALPPLKDSLQHLRVNLSHALAAASRAGLLEKQRVWLQQRRASASSSSSAEVQTGKGVASTRQTALQRVSSLSAAARFTATNTTKNNQGTAAAKRTLECKEECVEASLSLVILRVAKDRAVATLFLRQLRLDAYERHQLHAEVSLRHDYYVQRRMLRRWRVCAREQRVQHLKLLCRIVAHWQQYVAQCHALRACLCRFRKKLHERASAALAVRHAQLARCWQRWRHSLMWHRERSGLYEAAVRFADAHHPTCRDVPGRSELLALIHGAPLVASTGTVVATPVGHRLALRHLFRAWKRRTEGRLMMRLAVWHYQQCVRRRVARVVRSRARVLALRVHRARREVPHTLPVVAAVEAPVTAATTTTTRDIPSPSPPPPRAAVRISTTTNAAAHGLHKYKISAARRIAHAVQLRSCFRRWSRRFRTRCAERFHAQSTYTHVLTRWLHAVNVHHQQRLWKTLVLRQWAVITQHRRNAAVATPLYACNVLRGALSRWRRHCTLRVVCATLQQQRCLRYWRERAAVRAGKRVLRRLQQRRLLLEWHTRAATRVDTRAHLYVAATLSETGLLLGCVRRWRYRAAEHHRVRLAWEVFVQLRRERQCRRCFTAWQRRAFGPSATRLPRQRAGAAGAGAPSSPAMSLLV